MAVLVVFVRGTVSLSSKPSKSLLEHVDAQRLYACYEHVDSQVEFVRVNEQRVVHVAANNARLVHVYLLNIVCNEDTTPAREGVRFYDPQVFPLILRFEFMVVSVEVGELIG